jgi:hypothetical protein
VQSGKFTPGITAQGKIGLIRFPAQRPRGDKGWLRDAPAGDERETPKHIPLHIFCPLFEISVYKGII